MRRWSGALILALSLGLGGCEDEMSDAQIVAARADQTLRQLIAGMNAQKPPVLKTLLVMTSTTGGAPRPLRDEEVKTLVFPEPPFVYAGPGAPGYMRLKDGAGEIHRVHLVVVGDELRVVARRATLGGAGLSATVTTFLEPIPAGAK